MCMALPGGTQSGPPQKLVWRQMQWLGFAALLSAMIAVGLTKWLRNRLPATNSAQRNS